MRALQLQSFDGPAGLTPADVPEPVVAADQVLVDVRAVGINFPDLLCTRGQYQYRPSLPAVVGCEIAGTVREAPVGSRHAIGDRVAAFVWEGGYAERVAVAQNALLPIPDGVDLEIGAATVVNYQTVHFALSRRGRLQPGERVLVLGAGGGIGSAAVQVALGLGATVIAGVAGEQQIATAAAAGASEVLVLEPGFAARVRELTDGAGVDVVVDPLGDWLFDEAVRTLAPEGRLLVIGFAAGEIPTIKVNRLLLRNASVVGVAWGAFLDVDPEISRVGGEAIAAMLSAGVVRPPIARRFAFEEIPAALELLGRGQIAGKAIAVLPEPASG